MTTAVRAALRCLRHRYFLANCDECRAAQSARIAAIRAARASA